MHKEDISAYLVSACGPFLHDVLDLDRSFAVMQRNEIRHQRGNHNGSTNCRQSHDPVPAEKPLLEMFNKAVAHREKVLHPE
jgi:hypothetical protein